MELTREWFLEAYAKFDRLKPGDCHPHILRNPHDWATNCWLAAHAKDPNCAVCRQLAVMIGLLIYI